MVLGVEVVQIPKVESQRVLAVQVQVRSSLQPVGIGSQVYWMAGPMGPRARQISVAGLQVRLGPHAVGDEPMNDVVQTPPRHSSSGSSLAS